ncbi:YihY/virulence factor BrkB family protein [Cryobacterium frigoriphilum]|uniref:YihY/virulence factor BrkB family protein n=1 Tax=Cryobacterium frigoriphilum TaxID=1259150 RepID=A0A4R9A977_9MICO|nr:YihY/virulence factor BrkB family protein [Cryobacterium frigoriphilum]TFD54201.1 YihY/virulence factor BrkB family protein [Cryobacterium frigoriphilum]
MKELIARVTARVTALKPVRVFAHFTDKGGSILSGGMSYQAIFAVFAAVWVGFSIAGLFLTNNPDLLDALFMIINQSIPGLIGDEGIIDPKSLSAAGVLSWTAAIALVGLLATALGWLSTTTLAVRTIFEMPRQTTFFLLVKVRELGLGLLFGLALVASAVVSLASTAALGAIFSLFQLPQDSFWYDASARLIGLTVVLLIDTVTLAALFRVLSRVRIPFRRLVAGALIGGAGLGIMKILGGALLGGATNNPLLLSFAVIIGLLIWFNLVSTVTLLAASWIAVGMNDAGIPPHTLSDDELAAETERREADALRLASRLELEAAQQERRDAPWYGKWGAGRRVKAAEARVAKYAEASVDAGPAVAPAETSTSAFGAAAGSAQPEPGPDADGADRSGRSRHAN